MKPTTESLGFDLACLGETVSGTRLHRGQARSVESGRRALWSMGRLMRRAGASEVFLVMTPARPAGEES